MNEPGSFNWYRNLESVFFKNLTIAAMYADDENTKRIQKIFPYIIAARDSYDRDKTPLGELPTGMNVDNKRKTIMKPLTENRIREVEPGSFEWYLRFSGCFVTYMARAIRRADNHNLQLINEQYPQMIAAFKMGDGYLDKCPKGFEDNTYNSPPKSSEKNPS